MHPRGSCLFAARSPVGYAFSEAVGSKSTASLAPGAYKEPLEKRVIKRYFQEKSKDVGKQRDTVGSAWGTCFHFYFFQSS